MDSASILALAIVTVIILIVQAAIILALAAHVMSRTSNFDSSMPFEKHDAEDQDSGPLQSVPYNAGPTPPATQNQQIDGPFDDTDSLYRMPTPPLKKPRRNAAVNEVGDGSSSVYSEPTDAKSVAGKGERVKEKPVECVDTPNTSERNSPASPESDYGPVSYRY